jgi:3-hydroxyisobutyrate dehydrogenase
MHITLAEADRMELKLPGLALVAGLYQAVAETGHARDGTHSLQLALASMSGIEWNNR